MKTMLVARKVRERVGQISDMTLYRWGRDEALKFPQPTIIHRRRYWSEDEIDAWLKTRALVGLRKMGGNHG